MQCNTSEIRDQSSGLGGFCSFVLLAHFHKNWLANNDLESVFDGNRVPRQINQFQLDEFIRTKLFLTK